MGAVKPRRHREYGDKLSLRGAAQRRGNPSQPGTIGRRIAPLRFETTPDYYLYGDISKPADRGWVRITAWPRLLFESPAAISDDGHARTQRPRQVSACRHTANNTRRYYRPDFGYRHCCCSAGTDSGRSLHFAPVKCGGLA